jgi:hypothetical protein
MRAWVLLVTSLKLQVTLGDQKFQMRRQMRRMYLRAGRRALVPPHGLHLTSLAMSLLYYIKIVKFDLC